MSRLTDREVYGEVRQALDKDRRIESADLIHLSVENGIVQLWGDVKSAAEKAAAEEIARAQPGTQDVIDSLTVAIESPALDERKELAPAVEQAVAQAFGVSPKDIGVASVEHGVVRLVGQADTLAEESAAIEAASRVRGVREVVSEVVIGEVPAAEAVEIRDDAAVKSLVNAAIAERGVTIYDEDTVVDGGIVYLRGRVVEPRERKLAEEIAAAVNGVKDTVNQLIVDHVVTSRDPDEALAARITQALRRDSRVSPAEVHVECVKGDARLFGFVDSIAQQNAAAEVARSVPGVRRVFNDVVITDRTSLGTTGEHPGHRREEAG